MGVRKTKKKCPSSNASLHPACSSLPVMDTPAGNRYMACRPIVLGLARVFFLAICQLPLLSAAPTAYSPSRPFISISEAPSKPADDPGLWLYLGIAAALVLSGGAFAGLTIALMGQVGCRPLCGDRQVQDRILMQLVSSYRMRSICRSSKPRVKARNEKMQPVFLTFCKRESIGFWSLCFSVM